jgi:hypothetical protein
LLHSCTKHTGDLRIHHSDNTLNFFLVGSVINYKGTLEFHHSLNNKLELINLCFFFIWKNVVIFEDLPDDLVELHERVGKYSFNELSIHYF